jgi:hypothetical protein
MVVRVTERDIRLVRDLALSHVLSRDQILALGYFSSVTRANTRLRELAKIGLVRRLETPFFCQSLYAATKCAGEVVGPQVARLLKVRAPSPRFVQHALAVTEVRLVLRRLAEGEWRFEQQLWRSLEGSPKREIRPDGLYLASHASFVEVDLGHVSLSKFREKLLSYRALAHSGACRNLYRFDSFRVLVVTTGPLRSRHLRRQLPPDPGFELLMRTFSDLGAALISSWS